jgi:AcrR family transcriptional regulator
MRAMAPTHAPKKKRALKQPGAPGVQLGEETARAMIVEGAARAFAQHGVRVASVAHILRAAKVSRRTFYRFYDSKEDVMATLYRLGTQGLVDACRAAAKLSSTPRQLVERCIDAHLLNARGLGRLVFVLGGEAQRHESPLHARRMQVHALLAELLSAAFPRPQPDVLLLRGILLSLEGITRLTLEQGDEGRDVRPEAIVRAKQVMMRLALAALFGSGADLPMLPTRRQKSSPTGAGPARGNPPASATPHSG